MHFTCCCAIESTIILWSIGMLDDYIRKGHVQLVMFNLCSIDARLICRSRATDTHRHFLREKKHRESYSIELMSTLRHSQSIIWTLMIWIFNL